MKAVFTNKQQLSNFVSPINIIKNFGKAGGITINIAEDKTRINYMDNVSEEVLAFLEYKNNKIFDSIVVENPIEKDIAQKKWNVEELTILRVSDFLECFNLFDFSDDKNIDFSRVDNKIIIKQNDSEICFHLSETKTVKERTYAKIDALKKYAEFVLEKTHIDKLKKAFNVLSDSPLVQLSGKKGENKIYATVLDDEVKNSNKYVIAIGVETKIEETFSVKFGKENFKPIFAVGGDFPVVLYDMAVNFNINFEHINMDFFIKARI